MNDVKILINFQYTVFFWAKLPIDYNFQFLNGKFGLRFANIRIIPIGLSEITSLCYEFLFYVTVYCYTPAPDLKLVK